MGMLESAWIDCPYCGEPFEIEIDCSAGGQAYVEDCAVCCQPVDIVVDVDLDGRLHGLSAARNDD
jgi:hypothetical protein